MRGQFIVKFKTTLDDALVPAEDGYQCMLRELARMVGDSAVIINITDVEVKSYKKGEFIVEDGKVQLVGYLTTEEYAKKNGKSVAAVRRAIQLGFFDEVMVSIGTTGSDRNKYNFIPEDFKWPRKKVGREKKEK